MESTQSISASGLGYVGAVCLEREIELARASLHLVHGERLRRHRRRRDAGEQFRAALEMFRGLGAEALVDGLSNAEIGALLFISRHTVAYHLRKVFTKLQIISGHQLRAVPVNGSFETVASGSGR
jgi:ATP/maltotriose-dependent transcriptional regulator MalT